MFSVQGSVSPPAIKRKKNVNRKVKRIMIIAALAVTALLLIYHTAAAFVLSDEYEGDGGFFARAS